MRLKVERWGVIGMTALVVIMLVSDFVGNGSIFFQHGGTLSTLLITAGLILLVLAWIAVIRKGRK